MRAASPAATGFSGAVGSATGIGLADTVSTVSLVLPPLCVPIYPCSDVQVSPASWRFVILC